MLTQADVENIKKSLAAGVQIVAVPQLFETPRDLAQRMADLILEPVEYSEDHRAWNKNDMRILEPEAGTGILLGAVGASWYPDGELYAIEIDHRLCNDLEINFPKTMVINADFLDVYSLDPFDRIIMNPPFINGADIKHIKHALNFLKSDGRLVSICADGPRQRRELKTLAEESGGFYESLPAGTFKDKGTNVNSALLVIEGDG